MKRKAYRLLVVGLIGGVMLFGGVPTAHAATVSERLTRLEKRVKALRTSDASQNTSIRSLKSRVSSLESSRRTMTARIVVLESSNTTMMARIAALEAENASLTATVCSLEATTSEIETRVCEVEASVEDLAVHDHGATYAPIVHNHANYSTVGHGHALAEVSGAESRFSSAESRISGTESRITSIENSNVYKLNPYVTVDASTLNGLAGPHVVFTGANIHIRNGNGNTFTTTGRGNLIVGYNEFSSDTRTGSHNVVIGPLHTYTSFGGLLAGYDNYSVAPHASVTGGNMNTASGQYSSVSGGSSRSATGSADWKAGGLFQDF